MNVGVEVKLNIFLTLEIAEGKWPQTTIPVGKRASGSQQTEGRVGSRPVHKPLLSYNNPIVVTQLKKKKQEVTWGKPLIKERGKKLVTKTTHLSTARAWKVHSCD
jgi:hypothetical protein